MPTAQQIEDLSKATSSGTQLPNTQSIRNEDWITPHAIQAVVCGVVEDGSIEVKSSFVGGTSSPDLNSAAINQDTTIAVGSVAKMFTSAALLGLCDQELSAKKSGELVEGQADNFPDGIDTHLSHFIAGLKEKFPDCSYLETIEAVPHFFDVTLRDLLNHTQALGRGDDAKVAQVLMDDPNKQFSCAEMVQFSNYNSEDQYGEFKYSKLGTELAGMVMELVTGKPYGQVLQEVVLDRVGASSTKLKSNETDANSTLGYCYITPCKLGEGESKKQYSGEINFNTSGNSVAAGGIKTTPKDADRFIREFLSREAGESSLFKNQEVVDALWRDEGREGKHNICGVNNYRDGTFGHNGDNGLSEASLKYNPDTGESYYYAAVGETLTFAVAHETLLKQSQPDAEITPKMVFARQEELMKAGYGFGKMKAMVDQNKPFGEIAEDLNLIITNHGLKESEYGKITNQENVLAEQYRPIITQGCLDQFSIDQGHQEEGPPLIFLLRMGLNYKVSEDPSLNPLIPFPTPNYPIY